MPCAALQVVEHQDDSPPHSQLFFSPLSACPLAAAIDAAAISTLAAVVLPPPSAWQPCIHRHRLRHPLLVLARPSSAFLRRRSARPPVSRLPRTPVRAAGLNQPASSRIEWPHERAQAPGCSPPLLDPVGQAGQPRSRCRRRGCRWLTWLGRVGPPRSKLRPPTSAHQHPGASPPSPAAAGPSPAATD